MAKRGNGEGTIYYSEKLNKWVGQFTAGRKDNGKLNRKSVYGNTRKEVKEKITKSLAEVQNDSFIDKSSITLLDTCNLYIEQLYKSNTIKEATYKRHLETKKIVSSLIVANKPIQDITIVEINNSLASISNYSNSIIAKVYMLISNGFNIAVLNKILSSNPFNLKGAILKPKSQKENKKVEALEIYEQNLFLSELSKTDDSYKDVFYVALFTGMRVGEILALEKKDIDLENKKIKITKTLTKDKNDKVILGKTTKTYAGTREIPFLDILVSILSNYTNDGYLFTQNQNFINPSTINTHFKKICKDAGIRVTTTKKKKKDRFVNLKTSSVNTHMLRHTFATRCIESGMSAVVLQKLLGHKDIETTLNTYTSVFDKFKKDEFAKVEEYFNTINKNFTL